MVKHISESSALQRLALGALTGAAVGFAPWSFDTLARGLLGWCCGAGVYLALAWWLALRFDAQRTRERALSLDPPSILLLTVMLLTVIFSLAVIVMLLQQDASLGALPRTLHLALGLTALTISWLLMHTLYAFHYAHRYYQSKTPHGLNFPKDQDPDYFDFLYHAFVVGMTSQVSDVQVNSREMRRLTFAHSVLSFAFNMVVLALSINVVAGLVAMK
ncbi:MAG: DUF1345 domain-containing protein [Gallionellaceae bacterium]|jgi:uncharacterized membrane protein|nr:DUF1345 domain-containing protein [Gallionellaceae bacterium]